LCGRSRNRKIKALGDVTTRHDASVAVWQQGGACPEFCVWGI